MGSPSSVIIVIALAPAVSQTFAQPPELSAADLEPAKRAVVMIEAQLDQGPRRGAGIVVGADTEVVYVATAAHLVAAGSKRADNIIVRFWQLPSEVFNAQLQGQPQFDHDVALLRVRTPKGITFHWGVLSNPAAIKEGDRVYAIGYPGTKRWGATYDPGRIEDIQVLNLVVQSTNITLGHSGGALIDGGKCIAGMVLNTDGATARALRIDRLMEIIERTYTVKIRLREDSEGCAPPIPAGATRELHGLKYVRIPAGEFMMGCSPGDTECQADETPHPVKITRGFWIGQTEVTQGAYRRLMTDNPSFKREERGANHPVDSVNWRMAADYCRLAGGRLPTEAEWEYAARGGDRRARYGAVDSIGWHMQNSPGGLGREVSRLRANGFGLYDMLGNVAEWTADWYQKYSQAATADPKGPVDGALKVLRGGSYFTGPAALRFSARYTLDPGHPAPGDMTGFRCVVE